jgi:hypothetical protein
MMSGEEAHIIGETMSALVTEDGIVAAGRIVAALGDRPVTRLRSNDVALDDVGTVELVGVPEIRAIVMARVLLDNERWLFI